MSYKNEKKRFKLKLLQCDIYKKKYLDIEGKKRERKR